MNTATKILCNGFPRTVAAGDNNNLKQTFVHSESEADLFIDHNKNSKNLYMNISRFREDMRNIVHDFPFDLDSPMKESAFSKDLNDREKIEKMREDRELAKTVLGDVWSDAQELVEKCWVKDVPVVSVFSGLGIHCHLLYQEMVEPVEEKVTTSQHLINETDIATHDRKIIPDVKRILRIPNSKRFDGHIDCDVYCIPMTELEVMNNSLHDMLQRCSEPKNIDMQSRFLQKNRPEMKVYEDVDVDSDTVGTIPVDESQADVPDNVKDIVTDIPLPCVRERFLSANPDHMVRFAGVTHLFQAGYNPSEVIEIINQIGWIDFDETKTKQQVKNIWKNRYSELSCSEIQKLGLCVYGPEFDDKSNDVKDCKTYNYTSGEALYPYGK